MYYADYAKLDAVIVFIDSPFPRKISFLGELECLDHPVYLAYLSILRLRLLYELGLKEIGT